MQNSPKYSPQGPPRPWGTILGQPGRFSKIFSKPSQKMRFLAFWGSKLTQKNVEIEGVGPIWRVPERNSVQKAVPGVPYGGMATHLVPKRCDLGSLGVPGPASTPRLDPAWIQAGSSLDPGWTQAGPWALGSPGATKTINPRPPWDLVLTRTPNNRGGLLFTSKG